MFKHLSVYFQYLLPQHALSAWIGKIAQSRHRFIKNPCIRFFIKRYQVNMQEALLTHAYDYISFNDFFTRRLHPHARPIASKQNEIASPADSTISQIGHISEQTLIQAKGHNFQLQALLADDKEMSNTFTEGMYATLYLSPRDYHRVHMPISGQLIKTIFVPGNLFSVNQLTASSVPNLYARNERLICLFETEVGQVAVILVGAMIVGSIKPAWLNHSIKSRAIEINRYQSPMTFAKGDEIGLFQLGSTVIVLFEKQKIKWLSSLKTNVPIRFGECIANTI